MYCLWFERVWLYASIVLAIFYSQKNISDWYVLPYSVLILRCVSERLEALKASFSGFSGSISSGTEVTNCVSYYDVSADMKQKQKTVSNNVSRKILMKLPQNKVWYVCILRLFTLKGPCLISSTINYSFAVQFNLCFRSRLKGDIFL